MHELGRRLRCLLPVDRGTPGLSQRWRSFLSAGAFDNLATRNLIPEQGGRSQVDGDELGLFALEFVKGEPLVSVLWSQQQKPEEWATCDCGLPAPNDPWYLAYLGCLGACRCNLVRRTSARQGGSRTTRSSVCCGSSRSRWLTQDLRIWCVGCGDSALRHRAASRQSALSLWRLPEAPHLSNEQVLPASGWQRRRYASNLVVVYEPGSVEDLALLWSLRGAHALYPGFPLAVPVSVQRPASTRVMEHARR